MQKSYDEARLLKVNASSDLKMTCSVYPKFKTHPLIYRCLFTY
jgi:hypothetical protein